MITNKKLKNQYSKFDYLNRIEITDRHTISEKDIQEALEVTHLAFGKDISIIEGNRGLFDGFDEKGSYSTAELAKLLKAPLIIVLTVKKVTRISSLKSCQMFLQLLQSNTL